MKRVQAATLLLILTVIGSSGCGESSQQDGGGQQPPATTPAQPAPTQPSLGQPTPEQNAMAVRPAETAGAPPAAMEQPLASQPPVTTPPAPAAAPAKTAAPSAATQQTAAGTLLRESELKEKPFIDATTLATLPAQSKVTILERNGGWFSVKSTKGSGWVRMLNVKVTEGAENLGSGTDLTQAATLATGRAGTGNVVSTSGLRGLSEETLQNAKPDYAQFDKLNSFGVDKAGATAYASKHGLTSRSVSYLPAPAK